MRKKSKTCRALLFLNFFISLVCKVVYWCLAFALAWLLQSILVCLQFGKFVLSIVLCSILQVLQFSLISIILSFCFYVYLYWSFILFLCPMSCECLVLSMFITSLFSVCKCSELCCCMICVVKIYCSVGTMIDYWFFIFYWLAIKGGFDRFSYYRDLKF